MMKMRWFLSLIVAAVVSSCAFIDSVLHGDVVARVGNNLLYQKDIAGLVPKGSSPEDSAAIVQKYVMSWATKQILLSNAENRLSREDKDLEQAMNDYRTSLLVYRYEKLYVEKNLDTLISEQECRDYYEAHKKAFVYNTSLVKARFIRISTSSLNCQVIRSLYKSTKLDDMDKVEGLAKSSAEKYSDFGMEWVPMSHLARELGEELSSCEAILDKRSYLEFEKGNTLYLVKVYDRVKSGEVTPYDYNINLIKESILSKRKQELIANLERNLLEEALDNNKLVIYSNND